MKKLILLIIICTIASSFIAAAQEYGDVNGDTMIDIVDSLLVAQHYVGLSPENFNIEWGDVNNDGVCDILDALLIARYFVGLIQWFPGRTPTPAPGELTPGPTDPPVLPREIEEFVHELKAGFQSIYIIDVEQSMLEIYPPRFNVSIYINPELKIAYRIGMFARSEFSIWVEEQTRNVIVELSGLTAEYFGIDPQPEGRLLIEGLMILTGEKEVTPEVLVMMGKINLHNYYSDGTIYFEYDGAYYKIYRDSTGQVQLDPDYPPIVKDFVRKLQGEIGNIYMVDIYDIYFIVPPEFPTWGVKVESIIDFQKPGELYSMDFHIQNQGNTIVVVSSVLSVNYAEIDPQPPGELLYEGILLWLQQYPTFAPIETYPISILTQIIINKVNPGPVIYFTDPMDAEWMIYREGEKVILEPVVDYLEVIHNWAEEQDIALTGYGIVQIESESTDHILPGYTFFSLYLIQYPVAYWPPDELLGTNSVVAIDTALTVELIPDESTLEVFYRDHQIPLSTDEDRVHSIKAWLRLSQEYKNDGYYTFHISDDDITVEYIIADYLEWRITGISRVISGGEGLITAIAYFGVDGMLAYVNEKYELIPGPRPICQSTKLLDPDPVVRKMAEQDLLVMGYSAEDYLTVQRAKSSPELQEAIDRIWERIIQQEEKRERILKLLSGLSE